MSAGAGAELVGHRGAPSWRFASDRVEALVTRQGGHLAPVTFQTARGPVQPFALAPWDGDSLPAGTPGVLRPLRGDFFCLPFGGNAAPWRGERHPVHGETAAAEWGGARVETAGAVTEFVAELNPTVRPGRVVKRLRLRAGETNLYCRHELGGFSGPMAVGHHAMLQFPAQGAARLALSPWREGRVCPVAFEDPVAGGYSSLRPGARFASLARVPLAGGGRADLTVQPSREGFEDLVMVSSRAGARLAWSAVTVRGTPDYVWFALKDPRTLASTILWQSNGGRHYAPWSGRHRRVLGVEEVTSYFHFGLAESARPNPLSARGVPTTLRLDRRRPTHVNYVMGVLAAPPRAGAVRAIHPGAGAITLEFSSGRRIEHPVDLDFFELG